MRDHYPRDVRPDFILEDQGDGWWHCPSPLSCFIIDGPAPKFGDDFWLVRTDPAIRWIGNARYSTDHPLHHPIEPTNFALVMAASRHGHDFSFGDSWSIPVYPVAGHPRSVAQAAENAMPAAKVRVIRSGLDDSNRGHPLPKDED